MERKRCYLEEEEEDREEMYRALTAYRVPFSQVTFFNYLGPVFAAEDDDWPVVVQNLHQTRKKWAQMIQVLIR